MTWLRLHRRVVSDTVLVLEVKTYRCCVCNQVVPAHGLREHYKLHNTYGGSTPTSIMLASFVEETPQ